MVHGYSYFENVNILMRVIVNDVYGNSLESLGVVRDSWEYIYTYANRGEYVRNMGTLEELWRIINRWVAIW